jgi:hypothetical protein
MLDDIIGAVNQIIATIEEKRALIERRRKCVLAEEPSFSGMSALDGHSMALEHLRLAEDVLSDAVTELERIGSSD